MTLLTGELYAHSTQPVFSSLQDLVHSLVVAVNDPTRVARAHIDSRLSGYQTEAGEAESWLADLEAAIEDLRVDALSRRCRVSVAEVETLALHLSRIGRRLAMFKCRPGLCMLLMLSQQHFSCFLLPQGGRH
ncbi:unnamed protein product [Protopolystoma xenopodis]|uniref:Uncharacterized protein n=1 Tax=Protopolystoma xenopodis TaxID=117903 RepID=A0A3S5AGX2_9PLAT|nr:unnamed protein product [Protopolystoma xenopodis]